MKKWILVIAMVTLVAAAFAEWEGLGFEGGLEAGYASGSFGAVVLDTNYNGIDYYDAHKSYLEHSNMYYTEMTGYAWVDGFFYFGGAMTVQMVNTRWVGGGTVIDALPEFKPDFTNYKFEAGLSFNPVTIFVSHDCTHPQQTGSWQYRATSIWGEGAITRLGVRFRGEAGKVGER